MIAWNGIGEPITNLDKQVRVELRDGTHGTGTVGDYRWGHDDEIDDIVAYEWVEDVAQPGNTDAGGLGRVGNPKNAAGDKRIPLWLLSGVAKIHWALAQFAGLLKYGAWNWRVAGVRYSTYLSALERHIEGIKAGEDVDPVDGTDHLGNIMACAALILDARASNKLTDDRPPRLDHRPTIAFGEQLMVDLRERYKHLTPHHFSIADSEKAAA